MEEAAVEEAVEEAAVEEAVEEAAVEEAVEEAAVEEAVEEAVAEEIPEIVGEPEDIAVFNADSLHKFLSDAEEAGKLDSYIPKDYSRAITQTLESLSKDDYPAIMSFIVPDSEKLAIFQVIADGDQFDLQIGTADMDADSMAGFSLVKGEESSLRKYLEKMIQNPDEIAKIKGILK